MKDNSDNMLSKLVQQTLQCLEDMGYTQSTRDRFHAYYKVFLKYGQKHGITQFSLEIGKRFLREHHGHEWNEHGKLSIAANYLQRHIWFLYEVQKYGQIITVKRQKRVYRLPHFQRLLSDYLEFEHERGLSECTISNKRHILSGLLEHLETHGIIDIAAVSCQNVLGFLCAHTELSVRTKETYQYVIRGFIKYLDTRELCRKELTGLFETISIHGKNAYPSYFTAASISKLLAAIDITIATGKRDYAMILLAAELGLRTGDIMRLKFENIDLAGRRISFVQHKTGIEAVLPMSYELVLALADYIKNGRPKSDLNEIFLKSKAPYTAFKNTSSLYQRLQKYFPLSGIEIPPGARHGFHALRSSLASNMLRGGTTMPVISNILGHRSVDTASVYLKIDIDGLRRVALEVPTL